MARGRTASRLDAAWLGTVPRQYSTGGRSILGRISKRGSKYLRTLLIQAAKVLLMRPHNWARYSFGPWLNSASERLHRNTTRVIRTGGRVIGVRKAEIPRAAALAAVLRYPV
jgi:transposase